MTLEKTLKTLKDNDIIEISFINDLRYDILYNSFKVKDLKTVYKKSLFKKQVYAVIPQNFNNKKWYDIYLL